MLRSVACWSGRIPPRVGAFVRSFSHSTSSVLSCDVILSSHTLRVLKMQTPGQGKVMTGLKIDFEEEAGEVASGVVVLQRFPLLFVTGNFPVDASGVASTTVGSEHRINPESSTFEIDTLVSSDNSGTSCPAFEQVPDASEVQVLTHPLHTGVTAIDVLTPIARGQNMLFAGARDYSTATTPSDAVTNALQVVIKNCLAHTDASRTKCIYVSRHVNEDVTMLSAANPGSIVQMCDSLSGTSDSAEILNVLPSQLHNHMDLAGRCARYLLLAHSACSVGNFYRRRGMHSIVMLDVELYHLELFWEFSSACLDRFVYGPQSRDSGGFTNSNAADSAGNSSEKRRFYAFIFQQVGEQIDALGGGSMSLFCRTDQFRLSRNPLDDASPAGADEGHSGSPGVSFSLEDFEAAKHPKRITDRIKLLIGRGIAVTPAVLKKLDIPIPLSVTTTSTPFPDDSSQSLVLIPELRFRRLVAEYVHEIKSHTDGHVVYDTQLLGGSPGMPFNTTLRIPAVVPNLSLSRVGGGSDRKAVHCGIPAIKDLTAQLRGDLSQVNDILPSDCAAQAESRRLRALSWMCALEQDLSAGPLCISAQVALLTYVQRGYYDHFIESIIRVDGADIPENVLKWARLKDLVFTKYDVLAFNRSLLGHQHRSVDHIELGGKMDDASNAAIWEWVDSVHELVRQNYSQFLQ